MADLPSLEPCELPVVSFPKSGRTWLRYAATLAELGPDFTHAGHATHPLSLGQVFQGIPLELRDRPVIFLHRNPIDTLVSYYFQILRKDAKPDKRAWRAMELHGVKLPQTGINAFALDPHYGIKLILDYNKAWRAHAKAHHGSVILKYEDFVTKPVRAFEKYFRALGHPEVDCHWIAKETTFGAMRAVQADPELGPLHRLGWGRHKDPDSAKVRRGKIKGYVDYLDQTTIDHCLRMARQYKFNA